MTKHLPNIFIFVLVYFILYSTLNASKQEKEDHENCVQTIVCSEAERGENRKQNRKRSKVLDQLGILGYKQQKLALGN